LEEENRNLPSIDEMIKSEISEEEYRTKFDNKHLKFIDSFVKKYFFC